MRRPACAPHASRRARAACRSCVPPTGHKPVADAREDKLFGMCLLASAVVVDSVLPNAQQHLLQTLGRSKEEAPPPLALAAPRGPPRTRNTAAGAVQSCGLRATGVARGARVGGSAGRRSGPRRHPDRRPAAAAPER